MEIKIFYGYAKNIFRLMINNKVLFLTYYQVDLEDI